MVTRSMKERLPSVRPYIAKIVYVCSVDSWVTTCLILTQSQCHNILHHNLQWKLHHSLLDGLNQIAELAWAGLPRVQLLTCSNANTKIYQWQAKTEKLTSTITSPSDHSKPDTVVIPLSPILTHLLSPTFSPKASLTHWHGCSSGCVAA